MYAADNGNEILMKFLLQAGSDPLAATNSGETAAIIMESRCNYSESTPFKGVINNRVNSVG